MKDFERSKSGHAHAVKSGVIAHKRDEKIIREVKDHNKILSSKGICSVPRRNQ
jgi:hypothetical protein